MFASDQVSNRVLAISTRVVVFEGMSYGPRTCVRLRQTLEAFMVFSLEKRRKSIVKCSLKFAVRHSCADVSRLLIFAFGWGYGAQAFRTAVD